MGGIGHNQPLSSTTGVMIGGPIWWWYTQSDQYDQYCDDTNDQCDDDIQWEPATELHCRCIIPPLSCSGPRPGNDLEFGNHHKTRPGNDLEFGNNHDSRPGNDLAISILAYHHNGHYSHRLEKYVSASAGIFAFSSSPTFFFYRRQHFHKNSW